MNVKLLYFAQFRDRFGKSEECLEVPVGCTVGALRELLAAVNPGTEGIIQGVAIAVNLEYSIDKRVLQEGDSVALIPQVSGGSRC